ncbi:MAG: phage tail sheath subtilisin-like domain-containing protein [Actinomycetota bacterium]|nr:phage tail sheath subtilisin-like domain-containing protein [Actinomycetota bacterium]
MPGPYLVPGVYVEEVPGGARSIEGVGTSIAAFLGTAPDPTSRPNEAVAINNLSHFIRVFMPEGTANTPLSHAVLGYFANGGARCYVVNVGPEGTLTGGTRRQGLALLEEIDEVTMVAAPGYTDPGSYDALLEHCERLKDRVAILDAPADVADVRLLTQVATPGAAPRGGRRGAEDEGGGGAAEQPAGGVRARQSDDGRGAYYFPHIKVRDPVSNEIVPVAPSGHIAGIWARTDGTRGVHKAPANEAVRGALDLTYRVTDAEQGELNSAGVNCIRFFSTEGIRVWGARTLAASSSEYRYLNVRRLLNYLEESILKGTRWIVFEPNDQGLWKLIRRDVSAFLTRAWRDGALMGATPEEAFFVKCDAETNTPDVVDAGMVITIIGVAPVKPAEFVIFRISQFSGGAQLEAEGVGASV